MARRRTPSPEEQLRDREIAAGVAKILTCLCERNPHDVNVLVALDMTMRFVNSPVATPKKKRQAKPRPLTDGIPTFAGEAQS